MTYFKLYFSSLFVHSYIITFILKKGQALMSFLLLFLLTPVLNFRNGFFGGKCIETITIYTYIFHICYFIYICIYMLYVLGGWRQVMTICTYIFY